ncbi:hypothetical protein F4801DRAFT_582285 [Xylaria longipes]|nr:hypothetical protein F4801DRAFT_582285 [Xylaria longipes]RYC64551.1 hypothetical protein CHU98_g1661 [Xylaria longipes]
MDALKKVIGGENNNTANTNAPNAGAGAGAGAAFVNKKYFGGKLGHDQLEKITDTGREGFEKSTGKDIPDKFSN